jgi:hypothetical protein
MNNRAYPIKWEQWELDLIYVAAFAIEDKGKSINSQVKLLRCGRLSHRTWDGIRSKIYRERVGACYLTLQ